MICRRAAAGPLWLVARFAVGLYGALSNRLSTLSRSISRAVG